MCLELRPHSRRMERMLSEGEFERFHYETPDVIFAGKPKDAIPLCPDPREASNTIEDGGTLVCEDENMTDDGDDIPTAEVSWDTPPVPLMIS